MKLPIFQVDAFTGVVFEGNPAAVVILADWLADGTMRAIAEENNCSETAFLVPRGDYFDLRWFTPEIEIDLCGHATIASAHVIFEHEFTFRDRIVFQTKAGELAVAKDNDLLAMDLPSRRPEPVPLDDDVGEALGAVPLELHVSRDMLAVFDTQADVEALRPDFPAIARLNTFAVIVTAPGDRCDFVSRFFAPGAGVPEDPVTGSAHCTLVPYWSRRLHKTRLHALQVSRRGGELFCVDRGERVTLAGRCVEYLSGEISI